MRAAHFALTGLLIGTLLVSCNRGAATPATPTIEVPPPPPPTAEAPPRDGRTLSDTAIDLKPSLTCETDDDCGVFMHFITEDDRCCPTCSPTSAASTWIADFRQQCDAKSRIGCAMMKCAAPPDSQCVEGQCTLSP